MAVVLYKMVQEQFSKNELKALRNSLVVAIAAVERDQYHELDSWKLLLVKIEGLLKE